MMQKRKRLIVAFLAVALAVVLGAGLLVAFLPGRGRFAGDTAELTGDDFEYGYASSLAYGADTAETNGSGDVYGWGYDNSNKDDATYAYITGIHNENLEDLRAQGVSKLVLNIPAEHNGKPLKFVQQDAFAQCTMKIIDINMPLSVYWQIDGSDRFKFDNASSYARADGETATFTAFKPQTGSGITTLILPSNVWIDTDGDERFEDGEPTYRYAEYLFKGEKGAAYTNLVVMPDVVNIFNGEEVLDSNADRPKMQGGLLSKSQNLESVYFCTGRSEVLHLYPLTFENCTSLTEISLSAGVYLEDGARVFQGSSSLEKFTIADEKTASAPLFYTVGADGALYTNNYSYSYMDQNDAQALYEWWKLGGQNIDGLKYGNEDAWSLAMKNSMGYAYYPRRIFDDWSADKNRFSDDTVGESDPLKGTLKGTGTGEKATYYATKDGEGTYEGGIGIPEGSYVFDVNGTDKSGGVDNENDFAKGTAAGQYPADANFKYTALQTTQNRNSSGTKATISTDNGTITVTEVEGGNQSAGSATINGVEYKSRMQFKKKSRRYLKIDVPFGFSVTAYFVGGYTQSQIGTDHPQLALFDSNGFVPGDDSKNYSDYIGTSAKTAKTADALATLEDVAVEIDGSNHLLKIEGSDLAKGTYYIAQPADDAAGESGQAQMYFLVITPSDVKEVADFEFQVEVKDWDGTAIRQFADPIKWNSIQLNRREWHEATVKVRALTAAGDPVTTEDVDWAWQRVDGWSRTANMLKGWRWRIPDTTNANNTGTVQADENGWMTFNFDPKGNRESPNEYSAPLVLRLTAGGHTEYLYFNVVDPDYRLSGDGGEGRDIPSDGKFLYPDIEAMKAEWDLSGTPKNPTHLEFTQERVSKYQILVSMPAKAKSADSAVSEYVNSFEFAYHETVEIGPNAFQNTFITVIKIPDRIAKIGASAFRFSEHLQTVYLPDSTQVGLNAFGQEADADPGNGTVYTAGKKNFFLIAPSRASYEGYLYPLTDDPQALDDENYNYFPIHAESVSGGFQNLGGKDASYDYTPYLTYEISVNFLKYGEGDAVVSSETRTFLYGMDAHFVKANVTTDWAAYSENYDNNAPVYFGRISGNTVQQVNTIPTDIPWSVAADGWYYDEDAILPSGDWYFGDTQVVTSASADDFTAFFKGAAGGEVNTVAYENYAQYHYKAIYDDTRGMQAVTETNVAAGSLLAPSDGDKSINTMPFAITLKDTTGAVENNIYFNVPNFQNIGEITLGDETLKAAPANAKNPEDTWKVPMLTVTFDYNGFPLSRIFEGFMNSAMEVEYEALNDHYVNDKGWFVRSGEVDWDDPKAEGYPVMYNKMSYNGAPYEAGYYRIKVKFFSDTVGGYEYHWSGVYNGERVDEGSSAEFYFILHIEPRKVSVSSAYFMQYSGEGFDLFEGNPYLRASYYDGGASLDVRGLPYAVGGYGIELSLYDPKNYYYRDATQYNQYGNPTNGNIYGYTPNLQWDGDMQFRDPEAVNKPVTVRLFILDGETPENWNGLQFAEGGTPVTVTEPMAVFGSEVRSYTYNGAPIPIEDAFGGVFSANSIEYTITHNGTTVPEIKAAGEYTIRIKPAAGYVWWQGLPVVSTAADETKDKVTGWTLDDFWSEKGGYAAHNTDTLEFTVFVEKREVAIPSDSYVPTSVLPPYTFATPIGGDYEVAGYHLHDFGTDEIPHASESTAWASVITEAGVYDVLLRLTDPANCTWASGGESHGDNFYVTARLYAHFDREKEYPTFADEDAESGAEGTGIREKLALTYNADAHALAALFTEAGPTTEEATYRIVKLTEEPNSAADFSRGEEAREISDAGYYGIIVTLNDPFLYKKDEGETADTTVAYYLVYIEAAEITRNTGSEDFWKQDHLFRAADFEKDGIELKIPDFEDAASYPLKLVAPEKNLVTVTYYLVTHSEGGHDDIEDPDAVVEELNKGEREDTFAWEAYSDALKVKKPGGYCAYVKVEAPNHKTYYDYISLHIYSEELLITLSSGSSVGDTVVYGEGKHTQAALREAVFAVIESITLSGGDISESENMKDKLNRDYFFFYFEEVGTGEEHEIGDTETYLDVGEYELHVRYSGPTDDSLPDVTEYIKFVWAGGNPAFAVTPRPITVHPGGTITGHTYFSAPDMAWQTAAPTYAYKDDPSKEALVTRGGKQDDPQISYRFVLGDDTFGSLNAISNAGGYTVEVVSGNPNYAVELDADYTYTISPLVLTLNDVASVAYNGEEQTPAITFTGLPENIVLIETKDYSLSYMKDGVAVVKPREVGTYTVTVTFVSGNYAFAEGDRSDDITFIIEGSLLGQPYLSPTSFPYTGTDLRAEIEAALHNYVAAAMSVEFYASDDGTGVAISEIVNAGNYSVKVTLTDLDYRWEGGGTEVVLQFTVARRTHTSLTVTAADIVATYGDTGDALRPAVSGLPQGLQFAFVYTYEGTDGTTYASSSDAPVNVGKYLVTVSVVYMGDANNEPFSVTATATLTIKARTLTFSLDPAEGAGGLVNAVFKDENGNVVALASADYTFAYSFKGAAVESMTKAGEYTVTVTLTGDAAKNNTLANNTAVYTLTQGLSGGGTGGDDDFDAGVALILMGAQVVLLGTVFGLAVKKKREEKANSEEEN